VAHSLSAKKRIRQTAKRRARNRARKETVKADVKTFLSQMHAVLRPVLEANPVPERGEIELDCSIVPKIELIYDPFETGEAERYDKPERF